MENVDKATITRAARLSHESYDRSLHRTTGQFVCISQFQLTGELFAFVELDDDKQNAYVVFRGTNSTGNWSLTNFQAYRAQFRILDDELVVANRRDIQGGTFKFPISGEVHQGFYRAVSWLWYGSEPVFEISSDQSGPYRSRLIREVSIIGVPLAIGAVVAAFLQCRDFLYIGAICGLVLDLLIIGFERGTWEGLLKKTPTRTGHPLFRLRMRLAEFQNVWFVGHSLGGALAVLGFALYRSWSLGKSFRDNARVITFGAPRVGDQTFQRDFETQHHGHFWNVVVDGDPVPETPPSTSAHAWKTKIWQRGVTGAFLFGLYFPWQVYARLWGQKSTGEWTKKVLIGSRSARFGIKLHSINRSYLALLDSQPSDRLFQPNSDLSTP